MIIRILSFCCFLLLLPHFNAQNSNDDVIAKKRDELLDPKISAYLNDSTNINNEDDGDETTEILNKDSSSSDNNDNMELLNSVNAVKVKSWGTIQTVKNYIAQKEKEEAAAGNKNESIKIV